MAKGFITRIYIVFMLVLLVTACSQDAQTVTDEPTNGANADGVPESVVRDLKLSDTTSLTIDECVDKMNEYGEAVYVDKNDSMPGSVVAVIDFDEVYKVWDIYPVEPLCIEGNYGIFHVIDTFEVPNEAEYWDIAIGT